MSPTVTPGYWQCPRCNSTDHYFAPRVVGQIGVANPLQIGDNEFAVGGARSVEKDVALCKSCGERSKWIADLLTRRVAISKKRVEFLPRNCQRCLFLIHRENGRIWVGVLAHRDGLWFWCDIYWICRHDF